MYNIFEISRYSRSYKSEKQLQEDLITGILIWCIERNNKLLQNIIEKSIPATNNEKPNLGNSDLECELQFSMRGDEIVEGRADANISADNCMLWIENKIVPNSIKIKQTENYHILNAKDDKDDNKNSWLLLITPDDKKYIEEEIFNRLNEKHTARTLWINWLDVYDICKNMIKDGEDKTILNELIEALDMQGLKPFEGFSKENIGKLREVYKELNKIYSFFNSLSSELEKHNIVVPGKNAKTVVDEDFGWISKAFYESKCGKDLYYLIGFDLEENCLYIDFRWRGNKFKKIINNLNKNSPDFIKELR